MSYDHKKQYRALIIRGKAITDLDNLLPAYANILKQICPCKKQDFKTKFNFLLKNFLPESNPKTFDNHRTEIAGKLFGMYYKDEEDIIKISERTVKLIEDSDQPAFFKDLCAKYQFPSGINKILPTVETHVADKLSIRQFAFLLKVLLILDEKSYFITKKQAGYYVLNSLDVLKRDATPVEVVTQIISDINEKIYREVFVSGKATSFTHQHINEQLSLLVLSNCIYYDDKCIRLNQKEIPYILALSEWHSEPPDFDFYQFDFSNKEHRKRAESMWNVYFANFSAIDKKILLTSVDALRTNTEHETNSPNTNTVALGDEGEEYVYQIERNRIGKKFPRLVSKIKKFGKIRGLGYDILSVIGEGENPDFAKYIEVKSTKRVTAPTSNFIDSVNVTRNEWVSAEQNQQNFYIYRVYFCKNDTQIFIMRNPYELDKESKITTVPLTYRIDFDQTSGKFLNDNE